MLWAMQSKKNGVALPVPCLNENQSINTMVVKTIKRKKAFTRMKLHGFVVFIANEIHVFIFLPHLGPEDINQHYKVMDRNGYSPISTCIQSSEGEYLYTH